VGVAAALAACSSSPARAPNAVEDSTLAVSVDDHLSLGLRLDALDVSLDGQPFFASVLARSIPHDLPPVRVEPGLHAVRVMARVSLACGLFGETRTRVTVVLLNTVVTRGGPARVTVDLFTRAPTARPAEIVGVNLRGEGAEMGVRATPLHARHAECSPLDPVAAATCDVEALVAEARMAKDVSALTCAGDRLTQIHGLRGILDDAEDVAADDHTTYDQAMHAQLRARFAEGRIRELANEAEACSDQDRVNPRRVQYAVTDACPDGDITALGESSP
jgi:hypothetical protein